MEKSKKIVELSKKLCESTNLKQEYIDHNFWECFTYYDTLARLRIYKPKVEALNYGFTEQTLGKWFFRAHSDCSFDLETTQIILQLMEALNE